MEKVRSFFKKAFEKICICLFAVFFIATYPWYKKAKQEMDSVKDEDV